MAGVHSLDRGFVANICPDSIPVDQDGRAGVTLMGNLSDPTTDILPFQVPQHGRLHMPWLHALTKSGLAFNCTPLSCPCAKRTAATERWTRGKPSHLQSVSLPQMHAGASHSSVSNASAMTSTCEGQLQIQHACRHWS